jgi:hypothetical protein
LKQEAQLGKRQDANIVARAGLLVADVLFGILFLLVGTIVAIAERQGYGLELKMLGICAVAGSASAIFLGVWLFLKAR